MGPRERIAVTGLGIVSALGPDAPATFRQIARGVRGFAPVTLFDVSGQRSAIAAQVSGLSARDVAPQGEADVWSRSDALGVLAAAEALASAGVAAGSEGLALCVGGTTGGMYEAEGVLAKMNGESASDASVRRLLSYPLSTTAERIAGRLGPVRRALTLCSACSSGAIAIAQGAAWLASGRAEYVLAGGTDGLCQLTYTGFNSLGAMDPGACRPFDQARAGLSLGEGSGFLALELESRARARGARILAFLTGWAVLAEAHHITHPEPSGEIAARIISRALARAGRSAPELDYVNAHGTGTVHNDAMEARALERALGAERQRVFVSSSKGNIGHTLGAAGAIEAALTVLAIEGGTLPATGGLQVPDPTLGLRHVAAGGQACRVRCAISNSFGFGGTGAVLVFEHAESAPAAEGREASQRQIVITGVSSFGPRGALSGTENAAYASPLRPEQVPANIADALSLLEPAKSRRFDESSALVTLGAEQALRDAAATAEDTGLVCGTAYGNVQRSVAFLRRVSERGPRLASPADFPHLVPSAPAGNASIYLGLTGPVVSVSDLATSAEAAVELGVSFIRSGLSDRVIAGAAEPADPFIARVLSPLHGRKGPSRGQGAGWIVLEAAEAAEARGARVYAELAAWLCEWSLPKAALRALPPPLGAGGERVLCANVAPELVSVLDDSAWGSVSRVAIAAQTGEHEALGGMALAAAAALVHQAALTSVLVCGFSRGRHYAALLIPHGAQRA